MNVNHPFVRKPWRTPRWITLKLQHALEQRAFYRLRCRRLQARACSRRELEEAENYRNGWETAVTVRRQQYNFMLEGKPY